MKVASRIVQLKNGTSIELRSPTPSEAKLLLEHLALASRESYRNLNHAPGYWENFSLEEQTKILADFESASNRFMLNAFAEGKIVAGLGFFGNPGAAQKHSARIGMSVQNSYANLGLGTEIVSYAMEIARKAGLHRVELSVRTYNQAGIRLYEKTGFQKVGLLKDAAVIDGEYVDEWLYQQILS